VLGGFFYLLLDGFLFVAGWLFICCRMAFLFLEDKKLVKTTSFLKNI